MDLVLNLLVDDGNKSRSNRNNIFGNYEYFACASDEHPVYGQMTTLLFILSQNTLQSELQVRFTNMNNNCFIDVQSNL